MYGLVYYEKCQFLCLTYLLACCGLISVYQQYLEVFIFMI